MRIRAVVSYVYFVRYRSTTVPTERESLEKERGRDHPNPRTRPAATRTKAEFSRNVKLCSGLTAKDATRERLWSQTNDMCRASYSISSSSVPQPSQCERLIDVTDVGGESYEKIAPDVWLRTNVTSPTRRTLASRRTRRKMLPRARSIKSCGDPLRLLVDTIVRYLRAGTWTEHELCLDGAADLILYRLHRLAWSDLPPLQHNLAFPTSLTQTKMKSALLAGSTTALVAALAISSTSAAPLEKRLMMALSLEASPTIPSLDLGGLVPTPTIPPVASELVSIITSVVDGVTSLIPTTIPSLSLPTGVQDVLPDATVSLGVNVPLPTPPPEADALAQLAQGALNAVPTMLLKNLEQIQSEFSSALASIAAAAPTPTPIVFVTKDDAGLDVTRTSTPTVPTLPTTEVINPLSVLANALPKPSDVVSEVTSVIGGVTSVLKLPALPQPTDLLPLLNSAQLPQLDVPGLLGDKQHLCIKDGNGNQIGLCPDGPLINDSEVIAI